MGIFNLFGKKSTHEEDLVYLTYMIMWITANADGEVSDDETAWIQDWHKSYPLHLMQKVQKLVETRNFDTKEMLRIINNCSEKEKALLLAEACGIVAADGVFEKSEIQSLKLLITSIGANEEAARDTILKLHGVDIYNPANDNQDNNQNDGNVMGFRSHHVDKDE